MEVEHAASLLRRMEEWKNSKIYAAKFFIRNIFTLEGKGAGE